MKTETCLSTRLIGVAYLAILSALAMTACANEPLDGSSVVPVEIVRKDGRYLLLRGGQPFEVKGAGLESGDMQALVAHGGNSFRTWRTDNQSMTGQEVLDRAAELGLTVALCIEIGRERLGFDYDDEAAVAAQLEYARGEVLKYKDHPALLVWLIGNEPNHSFKNPKVFDAINDISLMIHEIDGNHPTSTALAGFDSKLAGLIEQRSSDLDFVSIQMYGDIVNLPAKLEVAGWNKPYMVTEWGAIGHWEVGTTEWGAPIEQNSTDKAASYLKAWETALAVDSENLIGSYVFLWGQKQERTPTWYGMFLEDGAETPVIDAMHYIWNNAWPANRSPHVGPLRIDGQVATQNVRLSPGQHYPVSLLADDKDGDPLTFHWEVMRESKATEEGGDKEDIPETLTGLVVAGEPGQATLLAPPESGAYRLFVYIHDGKGKAGHANIPFLVQ